MIMQIKMQARLLKNCQHSEAYQVVKNELFHKAANELDKIIMFRSEDKFIPNQFKVDYELIFDSSFQLLTLKMSVHI